MPTPARSHLPMKDYIAASGILDDEINATQNNDADVALLRLPAPSLRGTFAKAYGLLAKLVSQIGWDELLKCRSQVFVMEEEYRMQKAHDPAGPSNSDSPRASDVSKIASRNGNGTPGIMVLNAEEEEEKEGFGPLSIEEDEVADDNASTRAVVSPLPGGISTTSSPSPTIPTIKVSTDSEGERERRALADFEETGAVAGLEKPKSVQQGEEEQSATLPSVAESPIEEDGASSFSNKRLCERWLDNLFMVLYEVSWFRNVAQSQRLTFIPTI